MSAPEFELVYHTHPFFGEFRVVVAAPAVSSRKYSYYRRGDLSNEEWFHPPPLRRIAPDQLLIARCL